MKYKVIVKTLNGISEEDLQVLIEKHLDMGYTIQNSQVQWYCGTIEGVYVFVKDLR